MSTLVYSMSRIRISISMKYKVPNVQIVLKPEIGFALLFLLQGVSMGSSALGVCFEKPVVPCHGILGELWVWHSSLFIKDVLETVLCDQ